MNIAAITPGTSFEPIQVVTYGPDLGPFLVADFYFGYHYGCTAPIADHASRRQFARRIRQGRLICHSVFVGDQLVAVYGTALRQDDVGPFVEIEFFLGDLGDDFKPVLRKMVMRTYEIARNQAAERLGVYSDHVRVRARGRKGWRRALKMVGCMIDNEGWCRNFNPLERIRR